MEKTKDKRMKKEEKINILIDSDVANQIDDQFALAYAFSCQDKLQVQGITIAPFRVSWQNTLSTREGLVESKIEAYRLMRLFGIKHSEENPFVYMGSAGFLSEGYDDTNPAVEKIISLAKEGKLNIVCLGPLTNVAMALRLEPKIAKDLKILWLGTDVPMLETFTDTNYIRDVDAFKEVIASAVELTVFPSFLARTFVTSTYEFESNIKRNNVTRYLMGLLRKFPMIEENLGLQTISDIGPIAYILHPKEFVVKKLNCDCGVYKGAVAKVNMICASPKNFFVWKDFLSAVNSNKDFYLKPDVYFISDTHFNHERKVRVKQVPFKTVEEMNEQLVKRWNSVVGPDDVVYHMGDFGDYEFIKRLNGKVVLVCGNYETYDFKNFEKFRAKLMKLGFYDVVKDGMYLDEDVLGQRVYLTHRPINHAKDAFTLFGHVHSLKLIEKFGFNVCCYYHNFKPLSVAQIKKYLNFLQNYADEDVFAR